MPFAPLPIELVDGNPVESFRKNVEIDLAARECVEVQRANERLRLHPPDLMPVSSEASDVSPQIEATACVIVSIPPSVEEQRFVEIDLER